MVFGFVVMSGCLGRIPFLWRRGAMLPLLLLIGLLMFRGDKIYVRSTLPLALVSLSVADKI